MARQHFRSRHQTVDLEGPQKQRHRRAAGDAKGDGWNQGPSLAGVVRSLRRNHAADVAAAETLGVLLGTDGVAVCDPVDHRRSNSGDGAKSGAKPRASKHQPPVPANVTEALQLTGEREPLFGSGARHPRPLDHQIGQLGNREEAEGERRQRDAVPQIDLAEGPPLDAGLRVDADHRDQQPERSGRHPAERPAAAERRHHRQAEYGEAEQFRRAEIEDDRAQHRDRHGEQRSAEQRAKRARRIGRAQGAPRLAALGERMAIENGSRTSNSAGHPEEDRRDHVGHGDDRGHAHQQRHRRERVQRIGERDQDRECGEPANSGDQPDKHADHKPGEQNQQP